MVYLETREVRVAIPSASKKLGRVRKYITKTGKGAAHLRPRQALLPELKG
jgi:hypothetical protein